MEYEEIISVNCNRQNQLRLLGRRKRNGLSNYITHAQKTSIQKNLSLNALGEEVHPLKERLAHLGKPQHKLANYVPWIEAARKSENEQVYSVQYHSLRLSQLGFEKGRRPFQLKQIGLRFWDILSPRFPPPQSELQAWSPLLALPDEILLYILWLSISMEYYPENSIIRLEGVCLRFRRLCSSSEIWRLMCSNIWGFPHSNVKELVSYKSWKRMYCEWTGPIKYTEIETSNELFVNDGKFYISEGEWRFARYKLIRIKQNAIPISYQKKFKKLRHKNLSRIFNFYNFDESSVILSEHVGYIHLWSGEYLDYIKNNPLSEKDIRATFIQLISVLQYLNSSIWSNIGRNRCVMLFSCWPCSIYFSQDLQNLKISFWWNDTIPIEIHNPDPRKYLFVAPEIILEDKPKGNNESHIWCLGVLLYALFSLQFPFGGVDFPAVRVLMSILDDTPNYDSTEWNDISLEGKDLVHKLLIKDPEKRISLDEIAQHPWLTEYLSDIPLPIYSKISKSAVYKCFNPKNRLLMHSK